MCSQGDESTRKGEDRRRRLAERSLGGLEMGQLYDCCTGIQEHIERNGLDVFKTRGEIALKTGFLISLVEPDDPDDPEKLAALKSAAQDVLGIQLDY
jgi:hypothetical protein